MTSASMPVDLRGGPMLIGLLATATSFVVGWIVGAAVVVIVAALLITATIFVRRLNSKASSITEALDSTRLNTDGLWEIADVNHTATQAVKLAAEARTALEPKNIQGSQK